VNTQKELLRQELRSRRQALSPEEAAVKSQIITQQLLDVVDWTAIKKLHIYSSVNTWNEINTTEIIDQLRKNWPHITIATRPAKKDEPLPHEQFDLIIVPVLGFDKDNYRLGLGGGWYDRFLANQSQAQTIGLAYASAEVPVLPREDHDIPLDKIITEV
jgi:5-formyltetrahydrofolate cyclo-ligase